MGMYTVRMVPNSLLGEDLIISNVFEKKTDEQVVVFVKKTFPGQPQLQCCLQRRDSCWFACGLTDMRMGQ